MHKGLTVAQLEISDIAAQKLQSASEKAHKSVDELLLWLLDLYGQVLSAQSAAPTDGWSDDEIAHVLQSHDPLTGQQILEKHLASGIIGSWDDLGDIDTLDWLAQQKQQQRSKYQW